MLSQNQENLTLILMLVVLFYIAGYISHAVFKYEDGCNNCKNLIALGKESATQGLQDVCMYVYLRF